MTTSGSALDPAVAVGGGLIQGQFSDGICSFKGIPYAAPIEGINRWLAPKPPAVLADTFDATQFGPSAPQNVPSVPGWLMPKAGAAMMDMLGGMTEPGPDCLSLNVWAPTEPSVSDEKAARDLLHTRRRTRQRRQQSPQRRRRCPSEARERRRREYQLPPGRDRLPSRRRAIRRRRLCRQSRVHGCRRGVAVGSGQHRAIRR